MKLFALAFVFLFTATASAGPCACSQGDACQCSADCQCKPVQVAQLFGGRRSVFRDTSGGCANGQCGGVVKVAQPVQVKTVAPNAVAGPDGRAVQVPVEVCGIINGNTLSVPNTPAKYQLVGGPTDKEGQKVCLTGLMNYTTQPPTLVVGAVPVATIAPLTTVTVDTPSTSVSVEVGRQHRIRNWWSNRRHVFGGRKGGCQ